MVKSENTNIFMDMIKDGLSYIPNIVSAIIFPPLLEGAEMVIGNIEKRMIEIEKKIIRDISSLMIIGFGGMLLIFSLFFLLIEHLRWTKTSSLFFIGIIILVIGLLLKLFESKR